jgi:hypothetical protein
MPLILPQIVRRAFSIRINILILKRPQLPGVGRRHPAGQATTATLRLRVRSQRHAFEPRIERLAVEARWCVKHPPDRARVNPMGIVHADQHLF